MGADAAADAAVVIILTAASAAFAGMPGIETLMLDQSHKSSAGQAQQLQTHLDASQLVQADMAEDEQVSPATNCAVPVWKHLLTGSTLWKLQACA